jgi:hypothetical protein
VLRGWDGIILGDTLGWTNRLQSPTRATHCAVVDSMWDMRGLPRRAVEVLGN